MKEAIFIFAVTEVTFLPLRKPSLKFCFDILASWRNFINMNSITIISSSTLRYFLSTVKNRVVLRLMFKSYQSFRKCF